MTKDKTLPMFDATWRINPRHRVELGYVRLARDSQKTITGEIRFGDSVFPVNATVNSKFDSDVWRLTYGWSFYREGGNELSLLLGLHTTSFKTKPVEDRRRRPDRGGRGPHGSAADHRACRARGPIDPQWRLGAWVQVFSLNYGDYEGSLVNGAFSAEYRLNRNCALGAGYTVYDYNLDVTKGKARGSFDYQFAGPMIYVTAGF